MLFLASQSPRRRELLQQLGLEYTVLDINVPEQRLSGEAAPDYVSRVARDKAVAGFATVAHLPGALVLGADTEVILGDRVFGKPADALDAAQMLRDLSGRVHEVLTTVWLVGAGHRERAESSSEVRFADLDESLIADYLQTGEWAGKAGAYGVQGRAGAFVEHLSGSYWSVMGLPLFETAQLLRRAPVVA